MLTIAARHLSRVVRDAAVSRQAVRPLSSLSLDKSSSSVQIGDLTPLDPSQWFSEFTDPTVRAQLSKLREIENDVISTVSAKTAPVDWNHWEQSIKSPGLVAELKKIHESMPVPDIEAEKALLADKIEKAFNPIIEEFAKLAKDAEEETLELEKRAEEVTYLRDNVGELTVEEFLDKYPSVRASIENDIANNKWFLNE